MAITLVIGKVPASLTDLNIDLPVYDQAALLPTTNDKQTSTMTDYVLASGLTAQPTIVQIRRGESLKTGEVNFNLGVTSCLVESDSVSGRDTIPGYFTAGMYMRFVPHADLTVAEMDLGFKAALSLLLTKGGVVSTEHLTRLVYGSTKLY